MSVGEGAGSSQDLTRWSGPLAALLNVRNNDRLLFVNVKTEMFEKSKT